MSTKTDLDIVYKTEEELKEIKEKKKKQKQYTHNENKPTTNTKPNDIQYDSDGFEVIDKDKKINHNYEDKPRQQYRKHNYNNDKGSKKNFKKKPIDLIFYEIEILVMISNIY